MSIVENIKSLCKQRNTSIPKLEKEFNWGNGAMYNWDKNSPSIDKLQKVADYFTVSTDYLLGRTGLDETDSPSPPWATSKDKRDFKKMLENDSDLMFDGVPMGEESRKRVMDVLTGLFWEAKQMNKQKK